MFSVSESGRLYGFGANNDGQVGNGEEKDKVPKPVHLSTLEDQPFAMLAAGSEHSAALTGKFFKYKLMLNFQFFWAVINHMYR